VFGSVDDQILNWAAYQLDVPGEQGEGFAFYFQNQGCTAEPSMPSRLQALEPTVSYSVTRHTHRLTTPPTGRPSRWPVPSWQQLRWRCRTPPRRCCSSTPGYIEVQVKKG